MRPSCLRTHLAHDVLRFVAETATLRFQPTKRPQLSAQKAKAKPSVQRASIPAPSITPLDPLDSLNANARAPARTTLADWTADAEDNDVNGFYGGEKRQRGGRKKRKKNIEKSQTPQNWDDIYDPSRPNNYDDYKHSDEKILEIREWKDRLYAHRMAKMKDSDSDDSEEHYRPNMNSTCPHHLDETYTDMAVDQFAPPPMSFVAPPALVHGDDQSTLSQSAEVANNPTGEDAYSRRMRLSGILPQPSLSSHLPAPHSAETYSPPSPPPPSPPPPPPPYIPSVSEEIFAQQPPPSSPPLKPPLPSISRAPVRYSLPAAPAEIPASEAELEDALKTDQVDEEGATDAIPRSLRPGQKGFAERLMSKYGWSKGSGLGAKGSGIVNPLRVQVEKQKKKPDSEGGGFVGPGGRGKILGGKKGSGGAESEGGKFGAMSEVIVLRGMVDGMDLDAEMEGSRDGGLTQEIGEECGEKVSPVLLPSMPKGKLIPQQVRPCRESIHRSK